jgi:DNA-binding Lrp family transcriptional regulator
MKRLESLSAVEREILYLTVMDAAAPAAKIAKKIGCKPHAVQAALAKFQARDIISRRVMINVFRLGYSLHSIYISLSVEGQRFREEIAQHLASYPATSVVLELSGEYDFFVSLVVRDAPELARFNYELSERFSGAVLKKDVAVAVSNTEFGEKVLLPGDGLYSECTYSADQEKHDVDFVDRRILDCISNETFSSSAQVARVLEIPPSTVEYRLRKLRERGIICADLNELRGSEVGLCNYMLLVGMKGFPSETHADFRAFLRKNPAVSSLSFEVGYWDYRLGVSVQAETEVAALVCDMRQNFDTRIASVQTLPLFYAHKVRDYPFPPSEIE